jgi:septum formation protein
MNKSIINKHFILGSNSERRFNLLKQIGVKPDLILNPNINEEILLKELPINYVKRMAIEKNNIFQNQYYQSIILTADTIVSVGRRILPKAINAKHAEECLELISGRRHKVFTSFCLFSPDHSLKIKTVTSIVKFKKLDKKEISNYIESNEWEGKAGGYAIQGIAASFINFLSGSYSNVVGLPLAELYRMLLSIGYKFKNEQ